MFMVRILYVEGDIAKPSRLTFRIHCAFDGLIKSFLLIQGHKYIFIRMLF